MRQFKSKNGHSLKSPPKSCYPYDPRAHHEEHHDCTCPPGPQGIQGPPGPPGATGPQGPPGTGNGGSSDCITSTDTLNTVCLGSGEAPEFIVTFGSGSPFAIFSDSAIQGGNGIANGSFSFADGQEANVVTTLAGYGKTDIDGRTGILSPTANGEASSAFGLGTTANGEAASAEGGFTQADGAFSHSEGLGGKATGLAAHVEGDPCLASGDFSHAGGSNTTAAGLASHTGGVDSVALDYAQWSRGASMFSVQGDAQSSRHIVKTTKTGSGTFSLEDTVNNKIITIPTSSVWAVSVQLIGCNLVTMDTYVTVQNFRVKNNVSNVVSIMPMNFDNAGEGTLLTSSVVVSYGSSGTVTGGSRFTISVTTTGVPAGNATRWVATVDSTQMNTI